MELSVREWLIIIGVLLIVAVVLDGYRRVRSERSGRIRVTLSKQARARGMNPPAEVEPVDPLAANPELPNGGARVIVKARREDLNLHESVPVLMESVHLAPDVHEAEMTLEPQDAVELLAEPEPVTTPLSAVDSFDVDESIPLFETSPQIKSVEPHFDAIEDDENSTASATSAQPVPRAYVAAKQSSPLWEAAEADTVENSAPIATKSSAKNGTEPSSRRPARQPQLSSSAQDVIIVNVISKDPSGFKGQDVLQILLACDMRFGDMDIFHRHEKANGKGHIQFSVANLVEPGTFNLDAIDHFTTPGVCFFLTLPGPEKSITAFNYMVETAQVLVKNLHGELRDDAHSVMTQQTIEHFRQRIRDFERKQLTLHL